MKTRRALQILGTALVVTLAACASTNGVNDTTAPSQAAVQPPAPPKQSAPGKAPQAAPQPAPVGDERYRLRPGTGIFVVEPQPSGTPSATPAPGPGVQLNYENADLREVVKNILGDVLGLSYLVDPAVQGTVTIRTAREIPRTALLSTLEMMLRMNGHTLVEDAGIYKVVPAAASVRGNVTPQLGGGSRALPQGYSVLVVPLRFVGARDMVRILEPFAKDAQAVRFDDLRNLLIISGTEREQRHLLDVIQMFDVDWISGMSIGLFTLQSADVKDVYRDLQAVLGDRNAGPLAGILRVVPIERMNALLVISPQPNYVAEAKKWIERLDQSGEGSGQRLYVYFMKNGRAEKLAPLLQQAFTGRAPPAQPAAPQLAPGVTSGFIGTAPIPILGSGQGLPGQPTQLPSTLGTTGVAGQPTLPARPQVGAPGTTTYQAPIGAAPSGATAVDAARAAARREPTAVGGVVAGVPGGQDAAPAAVERAAPAAADGSFGIARNIQIIADKDYNSLLIVATPAEYAIIEAALKRLDIAPRQVMIELTLIEVLLKDEFRFGVEWYFTAGADVRGLLTPNIVPSSASNLWGTADQSSLATRRGFNVAWQNFAFPGGIQAVINLLGTNSKTKIVANPHVLATDNQQAVIKVGDRIPIESQSYLPGVGTGNVVTTTTQYIETGILITVNPRINEGGLVTMELAVEASDPGLRLTTSAPPINSRSTQTLVTVQSGQTMVLSGLIRENKGGSTEGFPLLSEIPVIGALFGTQSYDNNRTELVFFITPRVVESDQDMRGIIDELRRRMEWLDASGLFPAPAKQ